VCVLGSAALADLPVRRQSQDAGVSTEVTSTSVKEVADAGAAGLPSTGVKSGPFGIQMGMSINELEQFGKVTKTEIQGGTVYVLEKPPKTHPDFERFSVMATPATGVCRIVAGGRNVETNVYGNGLRARFDAVQDGLKGKYGEQRLFDFLQGGSIWREANEWMRALRKKERVLQAIWLEKNGATLTDNLSGVLLDAIADSDNAGHLVLTYEFKNVDACRKTATATVNDAL